MSFHGEHLLNWRYTNMNSIGQLAIAVNVESCSYNDATLVEAHRTRQQVAEREGHKPPQAAWVDNPHKDGPGISAALWTGDGKPTFRFPGEIRLVKTAAECDAACADLRRYDEIGFDTESPTFVDGGGSHSQRASIGQACGDGDIGYIFLFDQWPECYRSFAALMSAERPAKIASQISHDVSHLQARFPSSGRRGAPLLINGQIELREATAHLRLAKRNLQFLVAELFSKFLVKRIDHRWWGAHRLGGRQMEYAITHVRQDRTHRHAIPQPTCD